jgi:hypothetical protein
LDRENELALARGALSGVRAMLPFMRAVPTHFAAGGLIAMGGAVGACALMTWYVRCSSVFRRGSESDVANQIGALVATAGVLLAFIALIIAALGVAMVVLQRGVVAARAAGRRVGDEAERALPLAIPGPLRERLESEPAP